MTNAFQGLTSEEAQKKLNEWGYNEIEDANKVSPLKLIFRQLKKNFIIYLLVFAALTSFFVGEEVTAYTILLVVGMVISITFIQEYKAEKAIQALRGMIKSVSTVIRNKKEQEVFSKELVPGDLLVLRTGERVPADCVLLEESSLKVNEAILTGESREVSKIVPKDEKELTDKNLLYMGTYVVNGRGLAKILHTGMNTRFGKIVNMISEAEKELPLQDKVNKITRYMVTGAIIISLSTGFLMVTRSAPLTPEILTSILILVIALAVSAFPEGLPVVLMTTLAVGANRMAGKNAIVNRMSIIETLGETTVICADKTGTITRGEMTVKKIYMEGKMYEVGGSGFKAEGEFLEQGQKVDLKQNIALRLFFKTAVICNSSRIERTGEDEEFKAVGSPTEAALLIMAAKAKIFRDDFNTTVLEEIPFNSQRKMMSNFCQIEGEKIVFAKGAPEVLLEKCTSFQRGDKVEKLTEKERGEILGVSKSLAEQTFRTLALAYLPTDSEGKNYEEKGLIFLGLVGMEDPPREEVKEALRVCYEGGIKVKMITGDHKETAQAVGAKIGLEGEILEGEELDKLTDDELARVVGKIAIFARVKPEHKLRIVRVLKNNGEVVTMTGDGVNDAPALKEAQIGVAMGKNGTDVARSVADLTLKDDHFATIVEAVREGRTIFQNIRKFVSYQLSCNFAELLILFLGVLLAPFLGWQTPILLALQILFMNLVTDDLPAITLAFNKSSTDIMKEEPRRKVEILNKPHWLLVFFTGSLMGFLTLATYYISFNILGEDSGTARTSALLTLILLEISGAFHFRSFRQKVFNRSPFVNIYLFWASVISLLATLIIIYSPIQYVFETTALDLKNWLLALILILLFVKILDSLKDLNNNKNWLNLTPQTGIKPLFES